MKKVTLMDRLAGTAMGKEGRNALAMGDDKASKDYHKKLLATARRRKLLALKRENAKADKSELYEARRKRKASSMYASAD